MNSSEAAQQQHGLSTLAKLKQRSAGYYDKMQANGMELSQAEKDLQRYMRTLREQLEKVKSCEKSLRKLKVVAAAETRNHHSNDAMRDEEEADEDEESNIILLPTKKSSSPDQAAQLLSQAARQMQNTLDTWYEMSNRLNACIKDLNTMDQESRIMQYKTLFELVQHQIKWTADPGQGDNHVLNSIALDGYTPISGES